MGQLSAIRLHVCSGILLFWGIAQLFPTRAGVHGFGGVSPDSRLPITRNWLSEGMILMYTGLVSVPTGSHKPVEPMSLCPFLLCLVALPFALSVWL